MTVGLVRMLRTFWACGFEKMTSASPSQVNQIGTRWGLPSGRTLDSQTTGSVARNRRTRAAARDGAFMTREWRFHLTGAAVGGHDPAWTSDDVGPTRTGTVAVRLRTLARDGDP